MFLCILLLLVIPAFNQASDMRYECGAHGRFEYCIDDIPGCVTGCHCHPGYFFDTVTKICEPNTKLPQDYRRDNLPQPDRNQATFISSTEKIETLQTLSTTNTLTDNVKDEHKDADNLSDWLYNQFFKTIENQVINHTNTDEVLTRRSGSGPRKQRRSRKKIKNKFKLSKNKKNDLRRKLLRITEDDSLFDSTSSSSSSEDSDSSSSDSMSADNQDNGKDPHKNDKEHGHKKILVVQKKPKPPLPSFIFLPNFDTPFYPPIGLPPPPAVPMYPLVPVPPVMPAFLFPGSTPNYGDSEKSTTTEISSKTTDISSNAPNTAATTGASTTPSTNLDVTTPTMDETISTDIPNVTVEDDDKSKANILRNINNIKHKRDQRKKILRKLRQYHNNLNRPLKPEVNWLNPNNDFVDQWQESKSQYDNIPVELLMNNDLQSKLLEQKSPKVGNIDFKYLTQLIHRLNPNNMTNMSTFYFNPKNNMKTIEMPQQKIDNKNPLPSRRFNEHQQYSTANEPDDSFYSNLGRQIASLIREVDSKGERQLNIEIEREDEKAPSQPIFYENNYAPRSYWERSIRSPLNKSMFYRDNLEYIKKVNEELFDLENKAEIAVTTLSPLSLLDLENIVNLMETQRQRQIIIPVPKKIVSSHDALNINLLPQMNLSSKNKNPIKYEEHKGHFKNNSTAHFNSNDFFVKNPRRMLSNPKLYSDKNKTYINHILLQTIPPPPPQRSNNIARQDRVLKIPHIIPSHSQIDREVNAYRLRRSTIPPSVKYQLSPMVLNYKTIQEFPKNKKSNVFQKKSLPLYYTSKQIRKLFGEFTKPTYFYHELNRYNYFD